MTIGSTARTLKDWRPPTRLFQSGRFSYLGEADSDSNQQASRDAAIAQAATLEAQGYRAWYATIFGQPFVDAWADYHEEAIRWHWETRRKLLRGELLSDADYTAYLAIWSRGFLKTTIARRVAVCDAALSASAGVPGYCLYVGGTDDKKDDHATSLGSLLERKKLLQYYPQLGQIQKTARGHSKGDQRDFKYLSSGYVFRFVSLDAGLAGGNIELGDADEGTRPTLIIPDDVDERGASAEKYSKRAVRFTTELLPMRQRNTLVFGAQNLIQRNTIFHQIHTGKIAALGRRFPTRAIPACTDLNYEVRTESGIAKAYLIDCVPTWPAAGKEKIQELLFELGPEAFLLECQHEVEARKTGLVLNQYNSRKHVISWSQFESVYGTRYFPQHWSKYVGHDWGNVHANVTSVIAVAAENSKLPGLRFLTGFTAAPQATVDEVALQFVERYLPGINTAPVRSVPASRYEAWAADGHFSQLLNAPREIARKELRPLVAQALRAQRFVSFGMSHEQKSNCEVYGASYGLPYQQINPGATGGISDLNRDFTLDLNAPDPFRPGETGLATLYLVVDDDQLESPIDDYGLKLWREQFLDWSWRETKETPTGLSDDKPAKVFDDAGNSLMMLYVHSQNLKPVPLTLEERIENAIPIPLREDTLRAQNDGILSPADQLTAEYNRKKHAREVERNSFSVVRKNNLGVNPFDANQWR